MPASRRGAVVTTVGVLVLALAGVGVAVGLNRSEWAQPSAVATSTTAPTSEPTTSAPTTTPPASTTTAPPPAPTTPPPVGVPADLRGQDIEVIPTSERVVALTFDAGGNADGLPAILDCLADEGVRGTFFLTGQWAAAHPDGVAAIVAAGHRVGNHSVSHPHLPALSDEEIRNEVQGAEQTIRAAGADPRPLFRFPFGDRDDRTIAAVNDLGYVGVRWTVDTLGWQGTSQGGTAQTVTDRAVGALRPGEIVLMHVGSNPDDGTTFDADGLAGMIAGMREQGYGFVTLDALVAP
jgi:peptidoglycan/xylan/chitin deacetylase (PgdA/CDA1 family)